MGFGNALDARRNDLVVMNIGEPVGSRNSFAR
jgi:hypothetical protein